MENKRRGQPYRPTRIKRTLLIKVYHSATFGAAWDDHHAMTTSKTLDNLDDTILDLDFLRTQIVGVDTLLSTPFGERHRTGALRRLDEEGERAFFLRVADASAASIALM